ncbi:MAG: hypothetical protein JST54_26290 [Deltaproteobacteria bacterium]|nr:hypothetical protein [Deltaproteobacteria bacterium]
MTTWHDASGNGRDASQANAIKLPQLQSATPLPGTGAALEWVQFSPGTGLGHTDGQDLDVDLSFLTNSDYTIVALVSRYGDTWLSNNQEGNYFIGAGVLTSQNNSLPYGALHAGWYTDTDFRFSEFGNDADANVPPNPVGSWQAQLVTCRFSKQNGRTIYLDGNLAAFVSDTTPLNAADQGAVGRGFLNDHASNQFSGGIAELLVYSEALGDVDRAAVESFLRTKWQAP